MVHNIFPDVRSIELLAMLSTPCFVVRLPRLKSVVAPSFGESTIWISGGARNSAISYCSSQPVGEGTRRWVPKSNACTGDGVRFPVTSLNQIHAITMSPALLSLFRAHTWLGVVASLSGDDDVIAPHNEWL